MRAGPHERVRFGVLGPVEAVVDGRRLALGGPKQSLVLALLLVEAGHVVSTDRLIDAVWGDAAAERSLAVLQVYVSNLRKALEPARVAIGTDTGTGSDQLIVTRRPGYLVDAGGAHVDVVCFAAACAQARAAMMAGDAARAAARYREALLLWRGDALADFDRTFAVDAIRARLDSERHGVWLEAFDAELAAGRHAAVLGELRAAVAENPLDERLYGQLVVALYRSGRQAEALGVVQQARARLVDDLGIEPSRELRTLERQVLVHDPDLDLPTTAASPPAALNQRSVTVLRSVTVATVAVVVDGQRIPLVRTVTTVGRRPDRHIVLDGDDVSRLHAELRRIDDGLEVVDVGSSNGTRVNGVRVARARLGPGDEVRIGRHVLSLEAVVP